MEKKRAVRFGVVLLVIAGGLSWFISRHREPMPSYQGKPLIYWLECYPPINPTKSTIEEADRAIKTIGTNAVPFLVRMLQRRDSDLENRVANLLTNQSLIRVNLHSTEYYQAMGRRGFWALGSNGYPAVPELIKLYQGATNDTSRNRILLLLGHMGPSAENAVPFLASLITNRQDPKRFLPLVALQALEDIHSNAASAKPALMNCLDDTNKDVRDMAIWVLTKYGSPIPPLLKCLNDPSPQVRITAALALRAYRTGDVRQAVPPLLNLLHDKNPRVKETAYQTLVEIDPKAAAPFEYGGVQGEVNTNHADSPR